MRCLRIFHHELHVLSYQPRSKIVPQSRFMQERPTFFLNSSVLVGKGHLNSLKSILCAQYELIANPESCICDIHNVAIRSSLSMAVLGGGSIGSLARLKPWFRLPSSRDLIKRGAVPAINHPWSGIPLRKNTSDRMIYVALARHSIQRMLISV